MPLNLEPAADKVIRVWMDFTPLDEKTDVAEQNLAVVDREAMSELDFYAVEWGGTEF